MVVDALAPEEQADRAASCDLMLDAFRYQGGATTLDAVASGLPVLCRAGQTPPSRLGVSVNRALGLEELVVADTTEYVERAVWLANHPDELEALRHRVATAVREGVLFDARRSAAGIEATCERMLREKGILA
jgi:protein O-GlcNAc transferase